MKEFLNFCVSLTKELHIAHVVIVSSNTVFIERIFNDAKLKKTSRFYRLGHLSEDVAEIWLEEEGLERADRDMILDCLGGCIPDIHRVMTERQEFSTLREYLDRQVYSAYAQIADLLTDERDFDRRELFKELAKEIVGNGRFVLKEDVSVAIKEMIRFYAEKEILFFDPETLHVTGNSRIHEKGMEMLLNESR